jgi:hypothetical protein
MAWLLELKKKRIKKKTKYVHRSVNSVHDARTSRHFLGYLIKQACNKPGLPSSKFSGDYVPKKTASNVILGTTFMIDISNKGRRNIYCPEEAIVHYFLFNVHYIHEIISANLVIFFTMLGFIFYVHYNDYIHDFF